MCACSSTHCAVRIRSDLSSVRRASRDAAGKGLLGIPRLPDVEDINVEKPDAAIYPSAASRQSVVAAALFFPLLFFFLQAHASVLVRFSTLTGGQSFRAPTNGSQQPTPCCAITHSDRNGGVKWRVRMGGDGEGEASRTMRWDHCQLRLPVGMPCGRHAVGRRSNRPDEWWVASSVSSRLTRCGGEQGPTELGPRRTRDGHWDWAGWPSSRTRRVPSPRHTPTPLRLRAAR